MAWLPSLSRLFLTRGLRGPESKTVKKETSWSYLLYRGRVRRSSSSMFKISGNTGWASLSMHQYRYLELNRRSDKQLTLRMSLIEPHTTAATFPSIPSAHAVTAAKSFRSRRMDSSLWIESIHVSRCART